MRGLYLAHATDFPAVAMNDDRAVTGERRKAALDLYGRDGIGHYVAKASDLQIDDLLRRFTAKVGPSVSTGRLLPVGVVTTPWTMSVGR